MRRICIAINGIQHVLSNTDDVPLTAATADTASLGAWPRIRQTVDALGGVARFDDIDIDIVDVFGTWARYLRPWPQDLRYALAPNPINHDTTDAVTLDDASGLTVGDILYADRDTWRVTYVSGQQVWVDRNVYPCIQDGVAVRYQAAIGRDYVCQASPTSPPTIVGRLCAVYLDDVLEYVGHIVGVSQTGRGWRLRVRHVLSLLTQEITPPASGLRLRHPWTWTYAWWQCSPVGHKIHPDYRPGGGTAEYLTSVWTPGWSSTDVPHATLTTSHGWVWYGDDQPGEIADGLLTHGARAALGSTWSYQDGVGHVTCPGGLPPYGAMLSVTSTPGTYDYVDVSDVHYAGGIYQIGHLVGQWVRCGDQYLRVAQVDEDDGRVWFDRVADAETGEIWRYQTAGVSGQQPIELPVAPIVSAASLPDAVYDVLTGTGPLGLGLPPSMVDAAHASPVGGTSSVWWDWSQGGIDDDLRARSLAITMRGGRIVVRRMSPPTSAGAATTVTQADLVGDTVPTIERTHEAPVSMITYADAAVDWSVDVPGIDAITGAALRVVRYQTHTQDRIVSPDDWIQAQITRLRWLHAGVPEVTIGLLRDALSVGDVVVLSTAYVSCGHYRVASVPGVVLAREPDSAVYTLAINMGATATAVCWGLSLRVTRAGDYALSVQDDGDDYALWRSVTPPTCVVALRTVDGAVVHVCGIDYYEGTTIYVDGSPLPPQTRQWYVTAPDAPSVAGNAWLARQAFADVNGRLI